MELDDMNARIEARIGDAHGEDTSAEDAPAKYIGKLNEGSRGSTTLN